MSQSAENPPQAKLDNSRSTDVITLFVIARQDIYVDGLIRVISDHPQHSVVACGSPDTDYIQQFRQTPADILLIDQNIVEEHLHDASIDKLFNNFFDVFPESHIIVFGHEIPDNCVRRLLRAGVRGFIDNNTSQDLLAASIREVHNGGHWVGRKVLEQLVYSSVEMGQIIEQGICDRIETIQESLTKREIEVLQRVLDGMSTKEIASDLCLSEQSVKLHLGRLFKKFDVSNRSQLILMAFQRVCPVNNMALLFKKTLDKHHAVSDKTSDTYLYTRVAVAERNPDKLR